METIKFKKKSLLAVRHCHAQLIRIPLASEPRPGKLTADLLTTGTSPNTLDRVKRPTTGTIEKGYSPESSGTLRVLATRTLSLLLSDHFI